MTRLVILGAGGDGLVLAEAAIQAAAAGRSPAWQIEGFLDDAYPEGGTFEGFAVLGTLESWRSLAADVRFVPAIQKVGDMVRRAARLESLGIPADRWATVIHPTAVVASSARIGAGVYIGAFSSVQPRCVVGDFATLRAGAALGHDADVAQHAYVGPNAVLCGRTALHRGAHLGPGAVVLDNRRVGEFSVVGIGAAVTKDVPPFTVVMGNPAKRVGPVRRK
jgi:sugar O-acyltransferase (sialic acid O-acetyltransferase NeuD family)